MKDTRRGPQHRLILAACVLAHLTLIGWMARAPHPGRERRSEPLRIEFIETRATKASPVPPIPPFPRAPQRPHSAMPKPSMPARQIAPDAPVNARAASDPSIEPLSDDMLPPAIPDVAGDVPGDFSAPRREPIQPRAPKLPGRAEPFTPQAIALRQPITPEAVVKNVGALLFGGMADICAETRSRLHDLAQRNETIGDDELRSLIDRERRRCN